jgi:hypothetical protein
MRCASRRDKRAGPERCAVQYPGLRISPRGQDCRIGKGRNALLPGLSQRPSVGSGPRDRWTSAPQGSRYEPRDLESRARANTVPVCGR